MHKHLSQPTLPIDQHLSLLQQKIHEYERTLAEKNIYLAKLELDLEHAIHQCKNIAAQRIQSMNANPNQWINRHEPGLEHK